MVADAALRVDEVVCRPIPVLEGAPNRIVVIDRHRKADFQVRDGFFYVIDIFLEGKFRSMHANHYKSLVLIFFGPGPDIGDRAQTIDAGIGPEIDNDDLAFEGLRGQWRRIQPPDGTEQRRHSPFVREIFYLRLRLPLRRPGRIAGHRQGAVHCRRLNLHLRLPRHRHGKIARHRYGAAFR